VLRRTTLRDVTRQNVVAGAFPPLLTVDAERAFGVAYGVGRYAVVRSHVRLVERLDDDIVGRFVAGYRFSENVFGPVETKIPKILNCTNVSISRCARVEGNSGKLSTYGNRETTQNIVAVHGQRY